MRFNYAQYYKYELNCTIYRYLIQKNIAAAVAGAAGRVARGCFVQ